MMSKENVNYKTPGSIVVKRSPTVSGRKNKSIAASVLAQSKNGNPSTLRISISENIDSLNKALKLSEEIMPRPSRGLMKNLHGTLKSTNG